MESQVIRWTGEDNLSWEAEMGILQGKPSVRKLSYERNGEWVVLEKDLVPEFKVITSKRTKSNPQRAMALKEGEELGYQWDTYSDDPFSHKKDVQEATETYNTASMTVTTDGGHTTVAFDGLELGIFRGGVEFHFFNGTNLIRMEAAASTEEDGVAYLYHAGLSGLKVGKLYYTTPKRREVYENPGLRTHAGPDRDRERVYARGRVLTLGTAEGSVAVFPAPHRFVWGSQSEKNVGYNYYKYDDGAETMSIGVRHNKEQEHYNVRWPGYNAKPGTVQHMGTFFMPTADSVWVTRAMVMRYTNFDHLRQLPGYLRMGAHMHVATHAAFLRDKRVQRPWELLARENGFDIFAPCDFWGEGNVKDNRDLRKKDLERYQGMATYISGKDFLVVPAEEISTRPGENAHELIRFHCMYFPAKPTLYSRWREDDQSFRETLPDGRTYYHMASDMDFVNMAEESGGFILMPHPDTKANDGLPYDCRDEEWFKSKTWWGYGCRQLPADNSVDTMISGRTERVWNDVNNWADRPKYIMSELDTYSKVEESEEDWEMYPETNCTYVQLDEMPDGSDWTPLVEALKAGRHFYSTGEVLLEKCSITDGAADCTFSWTFPLRYAEIVYSDGENVTSVKLPENDCVNYGKKDFHFDFPKGMKWARVLASDIAGNAAFGMPVFLRGQN